MPTVNGATDTLNMQLLCNGVTLNCCTLLFVGLVRNSRVFLFFFFVLCCFGLFFYTEKGPSQHAFKSVDTNFYGFPWCWKLILEESNKNLQWLQEVISLVSVGLIPFFITIACHRITV